MDESQTTDAWRLASPAERAMKDLRRLERRERYLLSRLRILNMRLEGKPPREISGIVGLSPRTVSNILSALLREYAHGK